MLMKVHAKGQIVIPSQIRKALQIKIGDVIDIVIDNTKQVKLRKIRSHKSHDLAGCFHKYASNIQFPTSKKMNAALADGLAGGYSG
ncbi:MAG: AbrB family looped-hinge helix DNA binding protein [Candidatus Omnitrophota bacterium]|jgi:AbrB family looped-hinge helix DNA binding protein